MSIHQRIADRIKTEFEALIQESRFGRVNIEPSEIREMFDEWTELTAERDRYLQMLKDIRDGKYRYFTDYDGDVEIPSYFEAIDSLLAPDVNDQNK